ncbi:MAG TPA: ribonuclease P protein component [Chitinophagaceae bacterium]
MAKQFTLGKKERLKSRKAIEQLFKEGKSFVVAPFRVYFLVNSQWSIVNEGSPLQFGVGVSSRHFKKAVDRNRIKRLTREAYRLQKIALQQYLKEKQQGLDLFIIYTGKELPDHELVMGKLDVILNKLLKLINENNTSSS